MKPLATIVAARLMPKTTVISVVCRPPDKRIHLATTEPGIGTSVFTLCLERWKTAEPCREDSQICQECILKWKEKGRL